MKLIGLLVGIAALIGCAASHAPPSNAKFRIDPAHFTGTEGCCIVYDEKARAVVATHGGAHLSERTPACSTFKWPLAVIAFDAGVLKHEDDAFKWDGVQRSMGAWNRDQTARTWMRNSVVWVSQRLTAQLGRDKLQSYLDRFNYGNHDLSAGISASWLTRTKADPEQPHGSIQISPLEQLEFLKKFWNNELPVSASAIEKTKQLVYWETSPAGTKLWGKTGSGYSEDLKGDFGWYIARAERHGRAYLIVTRIMRDATQANATYPGPLARDVTKQILADNNM